MLVVHAIIVALLTWLVSAAFPMWLRWAFHFGAPIIAGFIYGLMFGDLAYGLAVGANIMMVYMGLIAVGGSVPSDISIAGYLGVAMTMLSGASPEVGLTIAVSLGTLGVLAQNAKMSLNSIWVHKADQYAAVGNTKMIKVMNVAASQIVPFALIAIPSFFAVYLGAPALESFLAAVPPQVIAILTLAGKMLPALGLGLLMMQMYNRSILPFLIIGFALASYLNLNIMAISILGVALALLHWAYSSSKRGAGAEDEAAAVQEETDGGSDNRRVRLTKADLKKSWFTWICFGQICYNYERMMGLGFTHSMIPIFKRLYGNDKEKLSQGLSQHLTFFNTENTWGSSIVGITASLEESKANGEEVSDEVISNFKTALMGPLAGIGDSITQALVKVILLAIAIDFAVQGSPVGVVLFVVLFSLYAAAVSYFMFFSGYRLGRNSVLKLLKGNVVKYVTEALGAVGMMVLGALIANNIRLTTPLSFTIGEVTTQVQPMLNSIMPNLLNLLLFAGIYYMLKKGLTPNKIIIFVFAAATIFSLLKIF